MKKSYSQIQQVQTVLLIIALLTIGACSLPGGEIPMGPGTFLVPKFIGASATPNLLPEMEIPEHPHLAEQGKSGMHADSYISGTYPWSGPLGNDPKVDSLSMGSLGGLVATVSVDSQGRLMCVSGDFSGFNLILLDPNTLDIIDSHPLPQRASMAEFWQTLDLDVIFSDTSGGAYFHLDRPIIANAHRVIQIFSVDDTGSSPKWQIDEEYDLNDILPDDVYITDAMPDWDGRIWFVTRPGVVGFVDPVTRNAETMTLVGEEIQNAMATAEDCVYIVSDHAMYRFYVDEYEKPQWAWRTEYDRGTMIKPGAINQGSGTTPTLLDIPLPGGTETKKLVAITDNADVQVNVIVYDRLSGDVVCRQPVFDENFSVSENSLIAYGRSIIVENNYLYSSGLPLDPNPRSHPGVTRIDLNPDCTSCTEVWESREASQTVVPKLSIGNGLIYLYTRSDDTPKSIMAWYLTAIDFKTGDTIFKIFTGTGILWNNSYGPITLGEDGTAYIGVFNGIISVRDGLTPQNL